MKSGLIFRALPLPLPQSRPQTRSFEGVPEMLENLRQQGVALAVATGKSRVGLDRVLRNTGIGHFLWRPGAQMKHLGNLTPVCLMRLWMSLVLKNHRSLWWGYLA